MKKPTTIPIFFIISLLLLVQPAEPADIIYTYDSGGGHDYAFLFTWESDTDVDLGSANTKVFTISNLTAVADFPHNSAVENTDGSHTGTTIGVPTEGNQIMITTTNLTNERIYLVGDHAKYFDVDVGEQVNIVYLDCYDSQVHDDNITVAGATNTSVTRYRTVRSSPNCATPFAGKAGTGATFAFTGTNSYCFSLAEAFSRLENLVLTRSANETKELRMVSMAADNTKIINCVVHSCINNDAANICRAIYAQENANLIYGCIVYGNENNGIHINAGVGETIGVVSCTAVNNGAVGINSANAGGTGIAFSNYSMDNTTSAFNETNWDAPSGWNGADDDTADLGGTASYYDNSLDLDASLNTDYLATASLDTDAGGAGDGNCGKNPYNNVTATSDFDDFFKNDTDGEAISKKDITGQTRPQADTADAVWDVGADEKTLTTTIRNAIIRNAIIR